MCEVSFYYNNKYVNIAFIQVDMFDLKAWKNKSKSKALNPSDILIYIYIIYTCCIPSL